MCTVDAKKKEKASICIIEDHFGKSLLIKYFFSLQIHFIFMLMSLEMSVQCFGCYKLFNK